MSIVASLNECFQRLQTLEVLPFDFISEWQLACYSVVAIVLYKEVAAVVSFWENATRQADCFEC